MGSFDRRHTEMVERDIAGHAALAAGGVRQSVERAPLWAARLQVAELISAKAREIVFAGCATEANYLALLGMARALGRRCATWR